MGWVLVSSCRVAGWCGGAGVAPLVVSLCGAFVVCGVIFMWKILLVAVVSLSVIYPPPPRLEGVLGCFRRWGAFFAF